MSVPLQSDLAQPVATPDDHAQIRRLMIYFAVVYVVEGIGQIGGIISQPLTYYLKEVYHWTPVEVAAFMATFTLPWVIKPLYGLISDFVPLFGYRRRSYLILANVLATGSYLLAGWLQAPGQLLFVLMLTAYAMAISSTLCGALLVENGQRYGASGAFVNQQWLWFNIASMCASLVGGQLIDRLSPSGALHGAALIAAVAPIAVVLGTWTLVSEEKRPINLPELKSSLRALVAAFKTKGLWIVGFFLFLYYFSPGLNVPLYYHMTDNLHFSQGYIGILAAIGSAGSIAGALLYRWSLTGMTSKRLLQLSIITGTVATAAFLLLFNEPAAAVLYFFSGVSSMITLVASLTLAADYCPKGSEGFAFAALMSVTNLATSASDIVGSYLFETLFQSQLAPLIIVSAAATAIAWVFIPLLHLGDKPQGQPMHAPTAE